jgi:hypothetical protein
MISLTPRAGCFHDDFVAERSLAGSAAATTERSLAVLQVQGLR